MDLMKSPLLAGLAQRLQFLSARTGVIAENIANADTPDYSARDVAPRDFKKLASASASERALRTSDPRHIRAAASSSAAVRTVAAPDGEAALNGNNVSLETQMMKLSETRMDYQLASSVYRKGLGLVRLAIGANR